MKFASMLALVLSIASAHAATGIATGTAAPDISGRTQDGKEVRLKDSLGKWVLLYFYPKDDTPGCTKQACQLRDEYKDFQKAGVVIYGISRQGAESHRAFKAKYHLPFDLLTDEDGKLGEAFGVDTMPVIGMYKRQSVLVDPKGKVARFFEDVDPATHSREVLKAVRK